MTVDTLIKEIMWEYNCTKQKAIDLITKYAGRNQYSELCEIVKYKRCAPEFYEEEIV